MVRGSTAGHLPWVNQDVVTVNASHPRCPVIPEASLYITVAGPPLEVRDADGGTRPQYLYPFSQRESAATFAVSGKFIFDGIERAVSVVLTMTSRDKPFRFMAVS